MLSVPYDDATLASALLELCVQPRRTVREWAQRTGQTGQAKVSYVGQHLASVHTGVRGSGSAARGQDLVDGSEVKTCSRADQLGKCKEPDCSASVQSFEAQCPECGGDDIKRNVDSHWLFSVKTETELQKLQQTDRVLLQLFDRETWNSPDIRFRVWEIWPKEPRHQHFGLFLQNYFEKNYDVKKERAAPANFHPLTYDFHLCNPILTLDATLGNADPPLSVKKPKKAFVKFDARVPPDADRSTLPSELMSPSVCTAEELRVLVQTLDDATLRACVKPGDEDARVARLRKVTELKTLDKSRYLDHLDEITEPARSKLVMREKRIRNAAKP